MTGPIIETDHLTKFYGKNLGLLDLDLEVDPGEIFAFLGPNGAGKTTAIRMFLDFIRPSRGKAKIFGLDSRTQSQEIRSRTGYLPGDLIIYENLTAKELLTFLGNLGGRADWDYTERLANRFGLEMDRKIKELSKGNRQKIGLVQTLMNHPELIILDEPTTGLDPLVRQEFYRMLREAKDRGQSIFLSSHILAEVERIADRVAIIREGRLVLVEDIVSLKARAPRRLEITFARPAPTEAFLGLPGVTDLKVEGNLLFCSLIGSVDSLMKMASRYEVTNIISQEPDLEEIFLTYYREEEAIAA